jgi:hypothetical protein
MVLAVAVMVSVWLLWAFLFRSNLVSYDGRKLGPGSIDEQIYKLAQELDEKLDQPVAKEKDPNSELPRYLARMESSFNVEADLWPVPPSVSGTGAIAKGAYRLPEVGPVSDVAVEHIRAVAYAPTEKVTPEKPYENAAHEANDIDLVTVEARIELSGLYDRFHESFAGDDIPPELRDPCLARPIFASVQLQRQELKEDGGWSDWEIVPRSRVEHHGDMFVAIENVRDLPFGGLKVRLLQFDSREVQMQLLQPKAYQIASANEEWFPPLLHRRYLTLKLEEEREEKRKAQEEKAEQEREDQSDSRRPRRSDSRTRSRSAETGAYETLGVLGGESVGTDTRSRRTTRTDRYDRLTTGGSTWPQGDRNRRTRGRTRDDSDVEKERERLLRMRELSQRTSTDDVYDELYQIQIDPREELSKMSEPLVFWAHDDTVEPGKTYRYRIRIGAFNPVAGTNRVAKEDISQRDEVVLWSEFSELTEAVRIPRMMYFFAKGIQEAVSTVQVQVSRYVLGHWYSEDFPVRQGEVIGKLVESETAKKRPPLSFGNRPVYSAASPTQVTEPEAIDYGTGAIMVDAVLAEEWLGGSESKPYWDMLYSFDGTSIEHMPVKTANWGVELKEAYALIRQLEREPKEPLRAWNSSPARYRPVRGRFDYTDIEYDPLMEEEMMMMQERRGR